jgi:hypothetical protein
MDPNATIAEIIASGITLETRNAYNEWVDFGGFPARVELAPHTDAWMSGDRYGVVVGVGHKRLHVHMDRSKAVRNVAPADVLHTI